MASASSSMSKSTYCHDANEGGGAMGMVSVTGTMTPKAPNPLCPTLREPPDCLHPPPAACEPRQEEDAPAATTSASWGEFTLPTHGVCEGRFSSAGMLSQYCAFRRCSIVVARWVGKEAAANVIVMGTLRRRCFIVWGRRGARRQMMPHGRHPTDRHGYPREQARN